MVHDTKQVSNKPHLGRSVRRLRELAGLKQAAFAAGIGRSQQSISKYEQQETLPDEILERLAMELGVTAAYIREFDEAKVLHGTRETNQPPAGAQTPVEKAVELFGQLLQSEQQRLALVRDVFQAVRELVNQLPKVK